MQEVSVTDLKKIYDNLNVSFELWKRKVMLSHIFLTW